MMKFLLIYLIKFYKVFFDGFIPTSCRYYPTCTNYFIGVLTKYSFLTSIFFIFKRLLKCNKFFNGGYDPIP